MRRVCGRMPHGRYHRDRGRLTQSRYYIYILVKAGMHPAFSYVTCLCWNKRSGYAFAWPTVKGRANLGAPKGPPPCFATVHAQTRMRFRLRTKGSSGRNYQLFSLFRRICNGIMTTRIDNLTHDDLDFIVPNNASELLWLIIGNKVRKGMRGTYNG